MDLLEKAFPIHELGRSTWFTYLLYLEVNLHEFGVEGILIILNIAAAATRNRSRGS